MLYGPTLTLSPALEPDGQPPADAILPARDGAPVTQLYDMARKLREKGYVTEQEAQRMLSERRFNGVGFHIIPELNPMLRPTRYQRRMESAADRRRRFLREAEAEIEAFLA